MFEIKTSKEFVKVENYLNQLVKDKKIPNYIILLFKKGKINYLQKNGFQDMENQIPIEFDTIFRFYSMTKPITAIGLMMLYEDGKFQLNDPIGKYIPEINNMEVFVKEENGKIITEKLKRDITILDLFTHTAGLSYGFAIDDPVSKIYNEKLNAEKMLSLNLKDLVELIATIPLRFQPGEQFRYSFAIDILGRLIEILSGKKIDVYFKEKIFLPLEMKDTDFRIPANKISRLSKIYNFTQDEKLLLNDSQAILLRYTNKNKCFMPGGGLVSTLPDYFNFVLMFLNNGKFKDKQLLQQKTIELMTKNHFKDNKTITDLAIDEYWKTHPIFKSYGYGLGFRVRIKEDETRVAIGEHGWSGLGGTFYWIDPDREVIGLFMTQLLVQGLKPAIDYLKLLTLAYEGLV
jgi:CubicO group peptidase (beta-lactamase class C family)